MADAEKVVEDVAAERARVGGVDVAYRRRGEGEPLLYLHGGGLTRRWLPLYGTLAQDFDVLVPEHPGYGDSVRPRWFRTMDDLVLQLADTLTELGLESAHVVGHSLGGLVAGSFVGVFPERVRSLTLITPAPLPLVTPTEFTLESRFADLDPDVDFDGFLFNDAQARYPEYLQGDDEGDNVAADDGSDPHADPDAFDRGGAPGLYRRLARYRGRAQIIVPDEDRLFANPVFELWGRYLGGAPLVHVAGSDDEPTGHLLIVQQTDKVATAISRFIHEGGSE